MYCSCLGDGSKCQRDMLESIELRERRVAPISCELSRKSNLLNVYNQRTKAPPLQDTVCAILMYQRIEAYRGCPQVIEAETNRLQGKAKRAKPYST